MKGGLRFYLAGAVVLLALAGCGRGFLQYGERASWRHQAEVACLKSGGVKLGAGVVQIEPIEGPGMCGADFPLKVAVLGEGSGLGYGYELRPPGAIPDAQMPRWPVSDQRDAAPVQPVQTQPVEVEPEQAQPMQGQRMRWVPGAPAIEPPQGSAPARYAPDRQPMSLDPPGVAPPDDIPDDAILPPGRRAAPTYSPTQGAYPPAQDADPRTPRAYNAPVYQPPQQRAVPPLGPMRGPNATAAMMPATVTPAATLACPLVSALDRWVSEGVQPAALHWFGTPVATIKQISAYSCRGMVGAGSSHISEHAFGNALDIAGFILADGRKITVKDGWRGTPEEQGFLHDVQLYACETFTTVLAPGYNVYHYDHIHVDLMRRESGRRPCRPDAIPGEVVAAKARAVYASRHRGPAYTGSVATRASEPHKPPLAVPGEDGYVADEDGDAVTGSIAPAVKHGQHAIAGADGEVDDDEVTGSIAPPPPVPARQNTVRPEDRQTQVY